MTIFLVVAGLTGSLITFHHELDAWLNPKLYKVKLPSDDVGPLSPFALRDSLLATMPSGTIVSTVPLRIDLDKNTEFYVDLPETASALNDSYFLNPYNGAVAGSRRYGDLSQFKENIMGFIYELHYSLALGTVGTYLMGVIALLWTLDCFVGAYITFPPVRKRTIKKSRSSWLKRWKPAWLIRTSSLFAFVFTWHRASGLWVWAMLFIFAWSSVGLNINDEVYNPVMNTVFGANENSRQQLPSLSRPNYAPLLTFNEAHIISRRLLLVQAEKEGFDVLEEHRIRYYERKGVYQYQVRSTLDVSARYPSTRIYIDGNTGEFAAFDAPTGQHAGSTITTWLYNLHWGSVDSLGLPYRIFICLMGIAVAVLSVTGVWIWLRKRRARGVKSKKVTKGQEG